MGRGANPVSLEEQMGKCLFRLKGEGCAWRILFEVKWRLSSAFLCSALKMTGGYISAPYLSVAATVLFILGGDWWLPPGDRLSAGDVNGFLTIG